MAQVNEVVGDLTPAFPQHAETGNLEAWRHGMELRDYFAGRVLPEMLARWMRLGSIYREDITLSQKIAKDCYVIADAMLEERKK